MSKVQKLNYETIRKDIGTEVVIMYGSSKQIPEPILAVAEDGLYLNLSFNKTAAELVGKDVYGDAVKLTASQLSQLKKELKIIDSETA